MDKKYITLSVSALVVLIIGIFIGCALGCCGKKMAVVDIMAVVNKSAQVEALKNEQTAKTQELTKWLEVVQKEVKDEKDSKKQEELLQKYNAEFVQKREEIAKDYNEKLQAIDKDINDTIIKTAKRKGYKAVIAKGVVIYGGQDITEEVIKVVK